MCDAAAAAAEDSACSVAGVADACDGNAAALDVGDNVAATAESESDASAAASIVGAR